MEELQLKNLYDNFRDGDTIKAFAKIIAEDAKKLKNLLILWKYVADIHILS